MVSKQKNYEKHNTITMLKKKTNIYLLMGTLALVGGAEKLPGVMDAVAVVLPFLKNGRKVVVFGDYDADGVCASAILVSTLRRLGAVVDAFIPRRFGEGYGMTAASLERLLRLDRRCRHAA